LTHNASDTGQNEAGHPLQHQQVGVDLGETRIIVSQRLSGAARLFFWRASRHQGIVDL
jgi:hypothetical protein